MWYITEHAIWWLDTYVIPIAYGYEYIDPTCPAARIPIRILECIVSVLAVVADIALLPFYMIGRAFRSVGPKTPRLPPGVSIAIRTDARDDTIAATQLERPPA